MLHRSHNKPVNCLESAWWSKCLPTLRQPGAAHVSFAKAPGTLQKVSSWSARASSRMTLLELFEALVFALEAFDFRL